MSLSKNFPTVRPTLLLDFANAQALDPRITFTRNSPAVYYDGETEALAEQNLTARSQEFNLSPWTVSRLTVGADATAAPDGTTSADSLTGTAGASGTDAPYFGYSGTVVPTGVTVTASIFAKKSTHDFFQIFLWNQGSNSFANFNLATGAIGTAGAGVTNHTMTNVGNNWYRCTMTFTTVNTGCMIGGGLVNSASATRLAAWTLVGTEVVFVWGAQLEQRNAVTAYTPTTTAPITNYIPVLLTASANTARFDHNPVSQVSLGLLVEETRINLATYSEQVNNALGWANNAAVVITPDTIVAPNGTLTGDSVLMTTGTFQLWSSNITVVAGQLYTASVYLKRGTSDIVHLRVTTTSAGEWYAAVFNLATGQLLNTLTLGSVSTVSSASIVSVGNGWYRVSVTGSTTLTTSRISLVNATNSNGAPVRNDNTSTFVWGAQLEAGAFATSYIATAGTTQQRDADVAVMTGTNFSSWYNPSEGTLYQNFTTLGVSLLDRVSLRISDTTSAFFNDITFRNYNGTEVFAVHVGGLPAQASLASLIPVTAGSVNRVAAVYKTNDFAFSMNQGAVTTDSLGTIPTVSQLSFPSNGCNYIRKVAYYDTRLTNSQLQALTQS